MHSRRLQCGSLIPRQGQVWFRCELSSPVRSPDTWDCLLARVSCRQWLRQVPAESVKRACYKERAAQTGFYRYVLSGTLPLAPTKSRDHGSPSWRAHGLQSPRTLQRAIRASRLCAGSAGSIPRPRPGSWGWELLRLCPADSGRLMFPVFPSSSI